MEGLQRQSEVSSVLSETVSARRQRVADECLSTLTARSTRRKNEDMSEGSLDFNRLLFEEAAQDDNLEVLRTLPLPHLNDTSTGWSLLHTCAVWQAVDCANWLLDSRANVDVRNRCVLRSSFLGVPFRSAFFLFVATVRCPRVLHACLIASEWLRVSDCVFVCFFSLLFFLFGVF